jgi:hypothetical protein
MKISKEIADVMGWKLTGIGKQSRYVSTKKCIFYLTDRNEKTKWYVAKLLQAKMVSDWCNVEIFNWKDKLPDFPGKISYSICASTYENGGHQFVDSDDEADGIIELFKKVYNIQE